MYKFPSIHPGLRGLILQCRGWRVRINGRVKLGVVALVNPSQIYKVIHLYPAILLLLHPTIIYVCFVLFLVSEARSDSRVRRPASVFKQVMAACA